MTITLTELHRKLGYYTDLAAQGVKITIEQSKPYKAVFELIGMKVDKSTEPKETKLDSIKKFFDNNPDLPNMINYEGDPVKAARKVRS